MKTEIGHLVFGVNTENLKFYQDLLEFLGWQTILAERGMLGVRNDQGASLWFGAPIKDVQNDYDGTGLNHIAVSTATQADVDTAAAYLQSQGVAMLFETPRHRAEFSHDPAQTYYQIMFESPDRILFEIVYIGVKA
jgi:catechol 2,3-dioxygenase-like lactoylglutathione lyase family enzyme